MNGRRAYSLLWPQQGKGFSLIEIVVALAVISFAIVGIMGLFPAAMKSALESQRETRAAYIARQILSDLNTLPGTNAFVANTTDVMDAGQKIDLSVPGNYAFEFDRDGLPVEAGREPAFRANMAVEADEPDSGLSRVEVKVVPVAADTNSPPFVFVRIVDQ